MSSGDASSATPDDSTDYRPGPRSCSAGRSSSRKISSISKGPARTRGHGLERSASTGCIRAARSAGYRPARRPTTAPATGAPATSDRLSTGVHLSTAEITTTATIPALVPRTPPIRPTSLIADAKAMSDDLAQFRHRLHRQPEVGLYLPRTQEKVLAELDGLPLEITTGDALSSVTAVLRGHRPGPTVLLRGVDYAAAGPQMHACGHDLHTTMLVGAARLLAANTHRFDGAVVLMFQPGEESDNGAGYMLAEGVLDASGQRPTRCTRCPPAPRTASSPPGAGRCSRPAMCSP